MPEFCLFAGTSEGRRLAGFLSGQRARLTVCVATEYGRKMLPPSADMEIIEKRLSPSEMLDLLSEKHFDMVIDATHPYAVQVTENIAEACAQTGTEYLRVLRETSGIGEDAVIVPDAESAVDFLNGTEGNILITTGSKELYRFTGIRNFRERVFARVLPMQASLEACTAAGLEPSHIIAMQGPFTEEMNTAILHSIRAKWLVTKESGKTGGFDEKAAAAEKTGAGLIVIGRPLQEKGLRETELIDLLCSRFGFTNRPSVKIIGIGPGTKDDLTQRAHHAIEGADCLIGAKRMIESAAGFNKPSITAIDEKVISEIIHSHREFTNFAVLMSGDSSFFSGTRRLLPLLADCHTEVLPGISSLSCLCAKLQISAEDIHTVSLHGRNQNIISAIRSHHRVFLLTGGENNVSGICQKILESGLRDIRICVGERLGYPDEKICYGSVCEILAMPHDPLSVMLAENPNPETIVTHGLPDSVFQRDRGEKGLIPMTKSEIRSVCLSKLALTADAVCWDIGSGTGSVAIEMALQVPKGMVYAIERDPDAVRLSQLNARKLQADNITFVSGSAPEILTELPTPTHVFIGGSSGTMKEIIELLAARHEGINVTATAVTLESVAELQRIIELPFVQDAETVLIQAAHARKAGSYHLMSGENPVYIFSMRISGTAE